MTELSSIDTGTEELLAELKEGILTLTLNRPDRLNAINDPMLKALSEQLQQANRNPEVRVIILTGAGRGFCSGLDLTQQVERKNESESGSSNQSQFNLFDLTQSPPLALYRMDKPVICAVNGAAAGYGMDLSLLCHVRIASESAKFAFITVRRNLLPESGATWLLPRLVGQGKAAELLLRGKTLSAEECLEHGLVNKVVPDEALLHTAEQWAAEIAAHAPASVQATTRMLRLGQDDTFESSADHLLMYLRSLMKMDDFQEGLSAFFDRRDPDFKGN